MLLECRGSGRNAVCPNSVSEGGSAKRVDIWKRWALEMGVTANEVDFVVDPLSDAFLNNTPSETNVNDCKQYPSAQPTTEI